MKSISERIVGNPKLGWLLFGGTVIVVVLLAIFASSIFERKNEAYQTMQMVKPIPSDEPRNEVWGESFPRQYESYRKTLNTDFASKHGGSEMRDYLEQIPELVVMWAGYGFSKDYNQGRGHGYAIEDLRNTLRTGGNEVSPMPATCWTCKSPDVPRLMEKVGITEYYTGKWKDKGHEIVNPIGCGDCHDNETMALKITRPALVEAFDRQGKKMEDFSRQEMRSLVCAQCHVEYYFDKKGHDGVPYLTFPWDNGFSAEAMEKYYDDYNFTDWTHKLSKAPMLKAQHPDYELFMTGVHGKRGVSCADCHMPYKSEGGQKFTDHHIQSPLNNVANSCQVCHRQETNKLIENVYSRQKKSAQTRLELERSLVMAHLEAKKAWDLGANEAQMKDILQDIRHAQWRWDYGAASHGGSFHSPVEIARVYATGLVKAQDSRIKLARLLADLGYNQPIEMPDISTKEKAQNFIGLDMNKLITEKESFKKNVIPVWLEEAKVREAKMDENSEGIQ